MEKFTAPGPLSFEGNIADKWKKWRQEFEFFLVATESDAKSDKIKSSILLICIGQRGRDIYNTFTFTSADDKLKLLPILAKFEEYYFQEKILLIFAINFFLSPGQTSTTFHKTLYNICCTLLYVV